MEQALNYVGPLSPFMWEVPKQVYTLPGSVLGNISDMRQYLADLNVNFDLIVKEFAHPYEHPVYDVFQKHPLHTCAFNKRQFDVLRYGMVVSEEQRLVIVEAPRACADVGTRVAREFKAIFNNPLDQTEISANPLLPEYSLIVMRLPAKDAETAVPELLFRMVFRNEAHNESGHKLSEISTAFPLFRLRSVHAPSACYDKMNDINRYRANHPAVYRTEAGKLLPNPKIEQILQSTPIRELCDAWLLVADCLVPHWVREKGVGPDVVDRFLQTHRPTGQCGGVQDDTRLGTHRPDDAEDIPVLDNRVRLNYTLNTPRMVKRVRVIKRDNGIVSRWRDGEFDTPSYQCEVIKKQGARRVLEPLADAAQVESRCVRMLMRPTRGGTNYIEDSELCAFVPMETEYADQHVYRTASAEKLRLWVLKGLMTAEINGVHVLLVEVDPLQLLSQCIDLLHGEGETPASSGSDESGSRHRSAPLDRSRESIFHVCKIVIETIEDYVQHSGVVWKVTIAVTEEAEGAAAGAVSLCSDILTLTQTTKARVEEHEQSEYEIAHGRHKHDASCGYGNKGQEGRTGSAGYYDQLVARAAAGAGNGAMVVHDESAVRTSYYGIPNRLAERAEAIGYNVRDESLYPLFQSLCADDEDTVPVKHLVRVLLDKLVGGHQCGGAHSSMFWPMENPVLKLDHCGIPCNERSVTNFVMGFSLHPYRGTSDVRATKKDAAQVDTSEPALNYVEFSMMMLALAYQ